MELGIADGGFVKLDKDRLYNRLEFTPSTTHDPAIMHLKHVESESQKTGSYLAIKKR